MRIIKCKACGAETIKIDTVHGKEICDAEAVCYWLSKKPNANVLTPNGENVRCVLDGKLEGAYGIGYTHHTCFQSQL